MDTTIEKHTVAEIVKKGSNATFKYLRQGIAYYSVNVFEEHDVFTYVFPVPLDDIGGATLSLYEKPMLMMRYIRKAFEENTMLIKKDKYDTSINR